MILLLSTCILESFIVYYPKKTKSVSMENILGLENIGTISLMYVFVEISSTK